MIGKLLQIGGKAALGYGRYQLRRYRTESAVALGVIGAAATAAQVYTARRRAAALRGKIVVITGGSRGLGLEIAHVFGRHSAHLVLAARNEEELQRAVAALVREGAVPNAGCVLTVVCDVTQPEDCERLAMAASERFGRIDVLINNAGIIDVAPFQDQPLSAFEEAMKVNFFGALHSIQAVLPRMQSRGEGRIVNIASVGGKIGVPHMLPYVASKYALVGFSQGLRAELSGTGVSVTTICPGLMRTGSHVNARFGGDAQAEYRWFSMGAMVPGVSISAKSAARAIHRATVDRVAEITITPQAWLAARVVGVAPGFAADAAGVVNRLLLPNPNGQTRTVNGGDLQQPRFGPLKKWSEHLQTQGNAAE